VDLASRRYRTERRTNRQFVRRSLRLQKVHSNHVDTNITPKTNYRAKVASMLCQRCDFGAMTGKTFDDCDEMKLRPLKPASPPFSTASQLVTVARELRKSTSNRFRC
jgi:hypothetical protein